MAACALLLAGCPTSLRSPPPLDGGTPLWPDAGPPPALDSDGEGLCDMTERARGTNPFDLDTDGDGFDDRVEVDLGFDPTRTDSPDRDFLVWLTETPGSMAEVGIRVTVRGQGQSYAGAFQTVATLDPEGADARDFYQRSYAVGAIPADNAFDVQPDEERILGVIGTTNLVFAVELGWQGAPRGCRRAYPWRYIVKRQDGTTLYARRYFVVIRPVDDDGRWCSPPEGGCI